MKIYRFSLDGFVPKEQIFKYKLLLEFKKPPNLTGLNDYQKECIMSSYKKELPLFEKLDLNDFKSGIWIFADKLPEQYWIDFSLNHLSKEEKSLRKLFIKDIDDSIEVYSPFGIVPKKFILKELVHKYGPGTSAYIPEKSL